MTRMGQGEGGKAGRPRRDGRTRRPTNEQAASADEVSEKETKLFKWLTPFRRPPEGVRACDDRGSYLAAVGLTHHRAWAVGQEPLG